MKTAALILIIGFAGVSLFGFFLMNHGDAHAGCIATVAQQIADCPEANALAYLKLHAETYSMLSLAVFAGLFFAALLFGAFGLFSDSREDGSRKPQCAGFSFDPERKRIALSRALSWRALHELSPTRF